MRRRDTDKTTTQIPRETMREITESGRADRGTSYARENSMPNTTTDNWELENVHADPSKRHHRFDVRLERRKLAAAVEVARVEDLDRVKVTFSAATYAHAVAEAARLFALVMDTAGDMLTSSDEPLRVDPDVVLSGAFVELEGPDAFLVACQHFGGDYGTGNAADAMLEARR